MPILTPSEAANWVRSTETDQIMLMLMPIVDAYIAGATGRDWSADSTIYPKAKAAAGALLTYWYDNPAQAGSAPSGSSDVLAQLEVEALKYRKYQFYGASAAGAVALPDALEGDDVIKLVGVYGVSGDQSANFETEISVSGQIQQTGGDLSANIYVVILKSPAEDVTA